MLHFLNGEETLSSGSTIWSTGNFYSLNLSSCISYSLSDLFESLYQHFCLCGF